MINFPYTDTKFSTLTSYIMALCARRVYDDDAGAIQTFCTDTLGTNQFTFLNQGATQAFVCADTRFTLICFRGTTDIDDWMTNIKAKLIDAPIGRAHKGFTEGLDAVYPQILDFINHHAPARTPLWLCGHSLGGALATLCALRLRLKRTNICGLYTFGSPRVVDANAGDYLASVLPNRIWRFVNNEDIVTRVPPASMGYDHLGRIRYFDNTGVMHKHMSYWRRFKDRVNSIEMRARERYRVLRHNYPDGVADHSMDRYIDRIVQNMTTDEKSQAALAPTQAGEFLEFVNG